MRNTVRDSVEKQPCCHHIAGRIAHAHTSEIDHCAQTAVLCQQISRLQIAVKPDRRPWPLRSVDSFIPNPAQDSGVERILQSHDAGTYLCVMPGKRLTAIGIVRCAVGIYFLQSQNEMCQIQRGCTRINQAVDCRIIALKPLINRPMPDSLHPVLLWRLEPAQRAAAAARFAATSDVLGVSAQLPSK